MGKLVEYAWGRTFKDGVIPILRAGLSGLAACGVAYLVLGPETAVENLVLLVIGTGVGAVVLAGEFLFHLLRAPAALERQAHAETAAELERLRGQSTLSREQEQGILRDSQSFPLWQAACIAGHSPYERPVPGGMPRHHLEQLRQDFINAKIQLEIDPLETRTMRAMHASRNFSSMVQEIRDTETISRTELKKYLKAQDIIVPGLADR